MLGQPTLDSTPEPTPTYPPFDIGFLVLRSMRWDEFVQVNELGEKIPATVRFGLLPSPSNWLPVFADIEDARNWSDGGRFPIIMLSQRQAPVVMPETVPPPCGRCGVIHWTECPFKDGDVVLERKAS